MLFTVINDSSTVKIRVVKDSMLEWFNDSITKKISYMIGFLKRLSLLKPYVGNEI